MTRAAILDELQRSIADGDASARVLVQAGPGTGKTEVAAARLIHLVSAGVRPSQILVLSFSRSAARTLMRRVDTLRQGSLEISEELRHLSVRTFDSWSFRMLRLLGMSPGDLLRRGYEQNIATLVEQMRGARISEIHDRLAQIRHIIVDELQDLGGVRGALVLEVLELLCTESEAVGFTLLGDEAQGIYGYAVRNGGDDYSDITPAELFRRLREQWQPSLCEVVLQKNYRSVEKLAKLAGRLRAVLGKPIDGAQKLEAMLKVLAGVPEAKIPLSAEDLTAVGSESAAILTRTNGEAIRIAQLIWGKGIQAPAIQVDVRTSSQALRPPAWIGATVGRVQGSSVSRSHFARIYQHLYGSGEGAKTAKALAVPDEAVAWRRLCIASGASADSAVVELPALRQKLNWPDAFPDDEGPPAGMLHIMTVHQSKGMEFANVAVAEPPERFTAPQGSKQADAARNDSEEASVLFVAMTRAGRSIKRIPVGTGHEPLRTRTFSGDRARWFTWRNGWVNLEVGIPGDVAQNSFVDLALHGTADAVDKVQTALAQGASTLRGRKVMLLKRQLSGEPRRYVYGIHLQEESGAGLLIGHVSQQVTEDLLNLLWQKGFGLPAAILNLRISEVVTAGAMEPSPSTAPTYAQSGLWLGLHLYGTGDFRSSRRQ